MRQRLGDLRELLVRDRQVGDPGIRVHVAADLRQELCGRLAPGRLGR